MSARFVALKSHLSVFFNVLEAEINRERAALQRSFANHVRPALHHKESVKALFDYMDGDGKLFIY